MNKLVFIILPLFFISCVKEKTIYVDSDNKKWLSELNVGNDFIMHDNNSITHSFKFTDNVYYFLESSGGFLCVTTHKTKREYYYQSFSSNYGANFNVSLTAGYDNDGDDLFIKVNNIGFDYNLKRNLIERIDCPYGYKYLNEDNDESNIIRSSAKILDSCSINNVMYYNVLHFTFKDFTQEWDLQTVDQIYYAPKYGLIKYSLNSGVYFERQ